MSEVSEVQYWARIARANFEFYASIISCGEFRFVVDGSPPLFVTYIKACVALIDIARAFGSVSSCLWRFDAKQSLEEQVFCSLLICLQVAHIWCCRHGGELNEGIWSTGESPSVILSSPCRLVRQTTLETYAEVSDDQLRDLFLVNGRKIFSLLFDGRLSEQAHRLCFGGTMVRFDVVDHGKFGDGRIEGVKCEKVTASVGVGSFSVVIPEHGSVSCQSDIECAILGAMVDVGCE